MSMSGGRDEAPAEDGGAPAGIRLTASLGSAPVIRTQPPRGGWLEVVCGPMFSGKSEELIRRLRRAEIGGQRALIVKPVVDDRARG